MDFRGTPFHSELRFAYTDDDGLFYLAVFQESARAFEKMDEVEAELEEAFGRLQQVYPNAEIPKIYSAVSVFYNDLFISDSLIILGLFYWLKSHVRPKGYPCVYFAEI